MKTVRIVGSTLIIIVCLVLLIFVIGIPVGNDMIASRVAKSLSDTPLPDNTEIIDSPGGRQVKSLKG